MKFGQKSFPIIRIYVNRNNIDEIMNLLQKLSKT